MILLRLKQSTRAHHSRTERALDLLRDDLTLEQYVEVLRLFYGFHVPWEAAVQPFAQRLSGALGDRRRAHLLGADLRHFGHDDAALAAVPRHDAITPPADLAEALGAMYVMEGSTLGGRHITAHLGRVLGLRGGGGCAYFRSYGDAVGAQWETFCDCLTSLAQPEWEEAIIAGARHTFDALHDWLTRERLSR